jgi:hypothetical protein
VRGLSRRFRGFTAVRGVVSGEMRFWDISVLNGAGKSTGKVRIFIGLFRRKGRATALELTY